MSSILDALNKLENEKELAIEQERETLEPEDVDPRAAAEEMLGRDVMRDKFTLSVNPLILIGGITFFVVVIAVVVAVSVTMAMKPDAPTNNVVATSQSAAPIQTPIVAQEVQTPAAEIPAVIEETVAAPIQESPAPEPVASAPIVEPPVTAPVEVAETPVVNTEPTPVAPPVTPPAPVEEIIIAKAEPEIIPPVEPTPERVVEQIVDPVPAVAVEPTVIPEPTPPPTPAPTPKPAQPEINVLTLPPLSTGLLSRHGLDELTINMVNPKSEKNPYGFAMINRSKVFEDSYISGSQVRLYKVTDEGIAVEVTRTGEKFFKRF